MIIVQEVSGETLLQEKILKKTEVYERLFFVGFEMEDL